ncbi:hypothetical protein NKDENANG_02113 [Candidatus Entotheonellaceae bacterium PAL068K]
MIQFEYPAAFILLVLLVLLKWLFRYRVRTYLAVSTPPQVRVQADGVAKPRWMANLPSHCLHAFLLVLLFLMSEPSLGKRETHEVKESRSILILLDTSASMIQTGLLKRVITGFLVNFIAARPPEDRLAVVRFDSDASGGIFTRNHRGLIMEITRPSMIQQESNPQDWARLGTKGTQIGIGLFKALTSFLEDAGETRMAEKRLNIAAQHEIYQEIQDLLRRFLWHIQQKQEGMFPLEIPQISNLENVGSGKALVIITDGQLLRPTSRATRIDYLTILDYYEQLGFRHIYFVSLKTHPSQLNALLNKNPTWKAYTWNQTQAGLQAVFTEIAKDIDTMEYGKSVIATTIKQQPMFQYFLASLVLLLMATGLQFHKRIRHFP